MKIEEWIKKAIHTHGNIYDYSKAEYKNSTTKIKIICQTHGIFLQNPGHHIRGSKCPKCSSSYKPTTQEWIKKAQKIHGNKYDYSNVVYKNTYEKLKIMCPEHGEFQQSSNNHLKGWGCSKCSGKNKPSTREFITNAKNIHGDKYEYSKSNYINSKSNIIIICHDHGEFEQTPNNHLHGWGCSKCNVSIGERKVEKILKENNISYISQKTFDTCKNKKPLRFDFYLVDYKILIEYDGEQHHKPIDFYGGQKEFNIRKKRDNLKTKWAIKNKYTLLRIKFDEKEIETKIIDLLNINNNNGLIL